MNKSMIAVLICPTSRTTIFIHLFDCNRSWNKPLLFTNNVILKKHLIIISHNQLTSWWKLTWAFQIAGPLSLFICSIVVGSKISFYYARTMSSDSNHLMFIEHNWLINRWKLIWAFQIAWPLSLSIFSTVIRDEIIYYYE